MESSGKIRSFSAMLCSSARSRSIPDVVSSHRDNHVFLSLREIARTLVAGRLWRSARPNFPSFFGAFRHFVSFVDTMSAITATRIGSRELGPVYDVGDDAALVRT